MIFLAVALLIVSGQSYSAEPSPAGDSAGTVMAADDFMQTFTGDLDAMEQARMIRVLTVYSVGYYYLDQGQAKGLVSEIARLFEQFINERAANKKVKVHVVMIPVARDKLIPALLEGRGDLIMASLSITPERQEILDFSIPVSNPVSEILVTGTEAPAINSIEDLAGHEIYVRASSSYRESLENLNKDSPQLAAAVNEFLKSHRQGTLLGNTLLNRYIVDFDWSKNALSREDYDRLEKLLDTFRKYGQEYEIDYLLAAAQGYQESRLDQNARSAAGAIGIMQLLPSTAKDPNVGVNDIHLAENNIQAGMKYLDFLRSRYFSDPGIDHFNQTLMSLAAYNAGPARMAKLREKAKRKGYDPNVWFDNVELVARNAARREAGIEE